jgi:hypothetical protein
MYRDPNVRKFRSEPRSLFTGNLIVEICLKGHCHEIFDRCFFQY